MDRRPSNERNGFGAPAKNHDPFVPDDKDESVRDDLEPDQSNECDCIDSGLRRRDRIPYLDAYDTNQEVEERGFFIPAYEVYATIVNVERDQRLHLMSPYKYTIVLTHGPFKWTIVRDFTDFQRLHNNLYTFHTAAWLTSPFAKSLNVVSPVLQYIGGGDLIEPKEDGLSDKTAMQTDNQERQKTSADTQVQYSKATRSDDETNDEGKATIGESENRVSHLLARIAQRKKKQACESKLPHFPLTPDSLVSEDGIEERKALLQEYLSRGLRIHAYRDHPASIKFLEVSRISFVHNLGNKYKEGKVKRRPGGSYTKGGLVYFCLTHCSPWKHCWLTIKDTYLSYSASNEDPIGEVILFDRLFKAITSKERKEETEGVRKSLHISNLQRELLLKCYSWEEAERWKTEIETVANGTGRIWTEEHPNGSAFPPRRDSYAHWLVDGRSFMEHAANMMEIAKEEIFITDWWLNPQIYLKRPDPNNRWRLDQILKRKAEQGVRIYVLVYREVAKVLVLGSEHMQEYLASLHPNIKVLRHPDHFESGVYSYAHHEKLVVVDQAVAFVGGIDLCYGRWDDHEHRLTDLGGLESHPLADEQEIPNLDELKKAYQTESSPPASPTPQLKAAVSGASVNVAFNAKPEEIAVSPTADHKETVDVFEVLRMKQQVMEQFANLPKWKEKVKSLRDELAGEYRELWVGKDYGNAYYKDLPDPENAFDDFVDRSVIPRMPWHDASSVVYGSAARDVARHFIQRWNDAKIDLVQKRADYHFLLPKSYENTRVPNVFVKMAIPCSVQVLRSSSRWSAGLKETEDSIQNAYINLISEAKHFILIENQFFVSQINGKEVHNKLAQTLFDRIVRAHRDAETFRVYILMPLLPAFTKTSGSMQMVLHWTCTSISKGRNSLLWNLQNTIGDYSEYITFCGLRNYGQLLGKLVTEIVYIHSKIMVVDDRFCIIGSANINDRSMLGNRDSEVAVLVKDTQFTPSAMNGKPYQSGAFAGSLRRRLFQEHLGLLESNAGSEVIDVSDPTSAEFFHLWNQIAKKNTAIFDQVFKCAPSNELKTLRDWAKREAETRSMATMDKHGSLELLDKVRGRLVSFPLEFLSEGDLLRDRFTAESLMPVYIFT